jgi:large subunit ribosomal protein L21
MYAVIKAGGKQHRVKPGDVIEVELMHGQQGTSVTFTPLLVVDDEGKTHVGTDLGKAQVKAKLLGEQKGDKVKVFKYRPKTGYARHQGHRQMHTMVEIEDVVLGGRRAASKKSEEEKSEEAPAAEAVPAPADAPVGEEASAGVAAEAPKPKATRGRAKRGAEVEGSTKDSAEGTEAPA